MFKVFGVVVAGVIGVGVLAFSINSLDYGLFSFFAPRYENVRNETFHNSQMYNDGMVRELYNLKREYVKADEAGKATVVGLARHDMEVYPRNRLPADLQDFYDVVMQ